jgi:hypothetical protein
MAVFSCSSGRFVALRLLAANRRDTRKRTIDFVFVRRLSFCSVTGHEFTRAVKRMDFRGFNPASSSPPPLYFRNHAPENLAANLPR